MCIRDRYICGKEIEIDAICDGTDVFIPGIMELVERTGIHSGDSISVYPVSYTHLEHLFVIATLQKQKMFVRMI